MELFTLQFGSSPSAQASISYLGKCGVGSNRRKQYNPVLSKSNCYEAQSLRKLKTEQMYWGYLLSLGRAALILGFSRARTRAHYSKTILFAFTTFTKLRVSRWEIVS